jgi:FKBP-type peptidyl-prolyl cis-trans isomerase
MAATGCEDKVPEPVPAPRGTGTERAAVEAPKELVREDLKVGDGAEAKTGDRVRVHYTGRLLKTNFKFDSSLDKGEPFEFTLGEGGVIKGWDQGVVGMKVGGKRKLTIPSDLGYGKDGSPPKIPADAPLVFEVELLAILPADAGSAASAEPSLEDMPDLPDDFGADFGEE